MSDGLSYEALLEAYTGAEFCPEVGWLTWEGAVYLRDKIGLSLEGLVPGMPVWFHDGKVETWYEDDIFQGGNPLLNYILLILGLAVQALKSSTNTTVSTGAEYGDTFLQIAQAGLAAHEQATGKPYDLSQLRDYVPLSAAPAGGAAPLPPANPGAGKVSS